MNEYRAQDILSSHIGKVISFDWQKSTYFMLLTGYKTDYVEADKTYWVTLFCSGDRFVLMGNHEVRIKT